MNSEPCGLITGTELWLLWADAHGVRYDDDRMSFDEVARDYYEASDAYGELLATDPSGSQLANQRAAVNTAYVRLLIEAGSERRGGDVDFYVDPVQVRDPGGRIVPRHSTTHDGSWESFSSPAITPEDPPQREATKTDLGLRP